MKMKIIMIGIVAALTIAGVFAQPGETNQVAGLVTEIVAKAKAGDAAYFAPKIEGYSKGAETNRAARAGRDSRGRRPSYYPGAETNLVAMILRSGMETNFPGRCLFTTNGTGRLDYHNIGQQCHFQIDVVKTNETWTVNRIWFCR